MPLYFKELEKLIIKWYNINFIRKPTDSAASWVTYKTMLKSAKENLLKNVLNIFKQIEKNEITVIPGFDSAGNYYIKIQPTQSKL
jgi:hypothetical protein